MDLGIEDVESTIKVIVVGNGGVGKSKGSFHDKYKQTLGTQYREKMFYSKKMKKMIRLNLWDTAGQEIFDSLCQRYYRGAGACLLVFSTIDRNSFYCVEKWNEKVRKECGKIVTILVENKVDLIGKSVVDSDESEALARRLGIKFFRICVKNSFGVEQLFQDLISQYYKYMDGKETVKAYDNILDIDEAEFLDEENLDSDFSGGKISDEEDGEIEFENHENEDEEKIGDEFDRLGKGEVKKVNSFVSEDDRTFTLDDVGPVKRRTDGKKQIQDRACKT